MKICSVNLDRETTFLTLQFYVEYILRLSENTYCCRQTAWYPNFLRYFFLNPWTENRAILVANISAPAPIVII